MARRKSDAFQYFRGVPVVQAEPVNVEWYRGLGGHGWYAYVVQDGTFTAARLIEPTQTDKSNELG